METSVLVPFIIYQKKVTYYVYLCLINLN